MDVERAQVSTKAREGWPVPRFWPWLAPGAYVLHLAEESLVGGGFVPWAQQHLSASFTDVRFLWINSLALPLVTVLAWIASRPGREWVALPPITVLTLNGLLHLGSSLVSATYSPGLVTGLLLYVPIGAWGFWKLRPVVPGRIWLLSITIAASAHAIVAWLAFGA